MIRALATSVLVAMLVVIDGCGANQQQRPNLVLILIDTLRADKLGCYGFETDTSPALDALAAGGVRFADVIAPSSWTRPSTGAMLTGIYPRTLGLYKELDDVLPEAFTTLAERLHDAGYATFGMTTNPNTNRVFQFDQGFDTYHDSMVVFDWMQPKSQALNHKTTPLLGAPAVFKEALAWADANRGQPCYMQLTLMEVHEHLKKLAMSMTRRSYRKHFRTLPDGSYLQATRQVTDDIGAFVDALREKPGWADSLFVVVSDHGEGLSDHPAVEHARFHGYQLFESQLRVPWLIFGGRDLVPGVIDDTVSLIDVAPTLLDLLGLETQGHIDGISWVQAVRGRGKPSRARAFEFSESYFRDTDKIAVYSSSGKYFENRDHWSGLSPVEFYQRGVVEQGRVNQQSALYPEQTHAYGRVLRAWESDHPKRAPQSGSLAISESELEQLRALGYVQ